MKSSENRHNFLNGRNPMFFFVKLENKILTSLSRMYFVKQFLIHPQSNICTPGQKQITFAKSNNDNIFVCDC